MSVRKRIVILGATGSIGGSALRVIERHADRLELIGIAARADAAGLAAIARKFGVHDVALFDEAAAIAAQDGGAFPEGTRLHAGISGLEAVASLPGTDMVLVAVAGTRPALRSTLAAIDAGCHVALASKEVLVAAGRHVMTAAAARGVRIVPVDSEHSALAHCLAGSSRGDVRRVVLTASGGALRDRNPGDLAGVTPADALRHPNWSMGRKITVDSATLANKGLEMIEAQWLFNLKPSQIEAVIHAQSIVHGLVEFTDGSILAQLTPPSMTFAIQHALLGPERPPGIDATLDFNTRFQLDFRPADPVRYPCLRLAREAMASGGAAPAVFNAANEVAVDAFLDHGLPFMGIPEIISRTMQMPIAAEPDSLDAVLAVEDDARRIAQSHVANLIG
ncbi:MAG TPA: 1-deoxy-D-xylulose-5-phosphate reductoisomerase [Opitutaceae bacterium]|nr:1-deoxy-D-xylulose-5-phosphate reductoisomerase [Opitutaceae bacterium]